MSNLLDSIFDDLDIEKLNQQEVKCYLQYLQEILPQLDSQEYKAKFLRCEIDLGHRLKELELLKTKEMYLGFMRSM